MAYNERPLLDWIAKTMVPRGLRPATSSEIDALLATIGGAPLAEVQVKTILAKAKGRLPVGVCPSVETPQPIGSAAVEVAEELLALHRNQGKELAQDIRDKLNALREEAKADKGQDSNDGTTQ